MLQVHLKSLEHSGRPSECYLISKKDASGPAKGKKKKNEPRELFFDFLFLTWHPFSLIQSMSLVP